ncbi:MAG: GNAT family N-acetyltransferase [Leptospiraceae bacterium]|nr:GNAT family N-acetyltransferase [Leptospiraceae bacterium]
MPSHLPLKRANCADLKLIHSFWKALSPTELYMLSGTLYAHPLRLKQLRQDFRALQDPPEGIYCFYDSGQLSESGPQEIIPTGQAGPGGWKRPLVSRFWPLWRLSHPGSEGRGNVLGCFQIRKREASTAMLAAVFIRPEYRRMGHARMMLKAGFHEARRLGLSRLQLNVFSSNPAIDLYLSLGFRRAGSKKVQLPDGRTVIKVFMQIDLG